MIPAAILAVGILTVTKSAIERWDTKRGVALGVMLSLGLTMTGCLIGTGNLGLSDNMGSLAIFVGTTGGLMGFLAALFAPRT